ncbi:hypothetical protein [Salinarimonas chemoclinalis]|uniref:hypothetical protein n=1 Tax=Salinarimonas chemoclinalis TaxID=3241599 RepID=UPI0035579CDC
MRFSADWQEDAPNAAPEEAATVADFTLRIADRNVTEHRLGRRLVDEITIPLYPIAESIAYGWWAIFGGRDRAFSISATCSGLQLPDISVAFDGALLRVSASPGASLHDPRRTTDYIVSAEEMLPRNEAERALDGLVNTVLERLGDRGVSETNASVRWRRVVDSRSDPEEASFCEAAGALGRDPYRIDDADADLIEKAAEHFSGEGLLEFLAGTDRARLRSTLDWIARTEARPDAASALPGLWLPRIAAMFRDMPQPARAWQLGYPRARAFRAQLGLTSADRTRSAGALARRLGSSPRFASATADPKAMSGIRALRSDGTDAQVHIHLRRTARDEAALFAFARACGDVVCFPEKGRSVVNDLQAAYRQAAGRAFAAEFLAPIEEIRSMEADGYDRLAIADEFGVSPEVIDRQIENASRIDEACAAH